MLVLTWMNAPTPNAIDQCPPADVEAARWSGPEAKDSGPVIRFHWATLLAVPNSTRRGATGGAPAYVFSVAPPCPRRFTQVDGYQQDTRLRVRHREVPLISASGIARRDPAFPREDLTQAYERYIL